MEPTGKCIRELLQHRNSSYFNTEDHFLAINTDKQFYITDLESHNGGWFPKTYRKYINHVTYKSGNIRKVNEFKNVGYLKANLTSIPSINCNELLGMEVRYIGTDLVGTISKFTLGNVGVNWAHQPAKFREYGLPTYWNEIKYLQLYN